MSDTSPEFSPFKEFIAGGAGGSCYAAVNHPLNTISACFKTATKPAPGQKALYIGTLDVVRQTIALVGPLKLYRGAATQMTGLSISYGVYFHGYGVGKKLQAVEGQELSYGQFWNAGLVAAVFTTTVTAPIEHIKWIKRVQDAKRVAANATKFTGPENTAKTLSPTGRIRSMYQGAASTLLREAAASSVTLMAYEWLKDFLKPTGKTKTDLSVWAMLTAGGVAGLIFGVIAIPVNVLKARLYTAPDGTYPRGIRDVLIVLVKRDGWQALYKGATPVILKGVPAFAACFTGYEIVLLLLR